MKPWNEIILDVLSWAGVADAPDLVARVRETHPPPAELVDGRLVVVKDGELEKALCFRCPGGCGQKIVLSLLASRVLRWRVRLDWLRRPTVEPSVRQLNACQCHFWIRCGRVEWCGDSGQRGDRS